MAVNYASKYSQNVDERFSTGSLTNGIVNGEFDWIGVSTVNVYSIPTSAMNDYSVSGTNRYGTPEELGNETQEMTLKQDRSFTFTIDRKNYDDTMMVMEAGKALRRQIDEVVIPEVDTYRISTLVAGAPVANVKTLATTKENAYEEFLAVQGILDDNEAPQFGRVVLCTPAYYNKIKLDESFTKKGDMATQIAITGIVGVAQVTNSVGMTGEASTVTSKALSMLAGDMSSFRNLDMDTVMNNFSSGLIGQSRALYKYGIDITNATLQQYAYDNGIKKSLSDMTQNEKMQLRMLAILDQSKVAWGDLAKTINSPSNQLRLLQNNFKSLSRTIGNMFLPAVAKVLPYVNGLVIAVRKLFEWTASMLGIKLKDVIGESGGGYSDAFDAFYWFVSTHWLISACWVVSYKFQRHITGHDKAVRRI